MQKNQEFILPLRVYMEDTDFGGIVHHAKYINFMERSRIEWLNSVGISLPEMAKQGCHFVVCTASVNYQKPIVLNELIEVTSTIYEKGRSSITFAHSIRNQAQIEIIYSTGQVKVVTIGDNGRPIRLPQLVTEKLLCQNPACGVL